MSDRDDPLTQKERAMERIAELEIANKSLADASAELQEKLALAIETLEEICRETYQHKLGILACHTLEKINDK